MTGALNAPIVANATCGVTLGNPSDGSITSARSSGSG